MIVEVIELKRYVLFNKKTQKYAKLGGGYTEHLQEAEVIGWGRSRLRERAKRWPDDYELRLVEVALVDDD